MSRFRLLVLDAPCTERYARCGERTGVNHPLLLDFFTESSGEQTKASAKHQKAARGRRMKARPTQSRKGIKGGTSSLFVCPLQGQGEGLRPFSSAPCRVKGGLRPFSSAPCGVWGTAPTVPRPTNPKKVANKGAGSEASLPVTLRVRRRASKLLFPQDSVKKRFFCLQAADSPQNR